MKYQRTDQFIYTVIRPKIHNAVMALQHLGFDNVYNISGSFMGLSFFEYYNDKATEENQLLQHIILNN